MTLKDQIEELIKLHGGLTAPEIAQLMGRTRGQNSAHVSRLLGREKGYRRRIYIGKWIRRETAGPGCPIMPVYYVGDKADAPRPKALPTDVARAHVTQNKKRYRDKLSALVRIKKQIQRGTSLGMWGQLTLGAKK